jgi:hypothetical protein
MECVVRMSFWKLFRGLGAPMIMCGFLSWPLLGVAIAAINGDFTHRYSISVFVVILACAGMFAYCAYQLILILVNGMCGISVEKEKMRFFTNVYRTVDVSDVKLMYVKRFILNGRVSLRMTDGSEKVILSNLMVGTADQIAEKLASITGIKFVESAG